LDKNRTNVAIAVVKYFSYVDHIMSQVIGVSYEYDRNSRDFSANCNHIDVTAVNWLAIQTSGRKTNSHCASHETR
jgi:hypothetical protein